ncbi:MAG: HAD hydrolase family protein [bacterium]|nr:MAG: HAD hydrolase family protein [bacterium]
MPGFAIKISKETNISFENMLGVGDSTRDWKFIELCKFVSAMGNSQEELKKLVLSKGSNNSYIAPSVDENGIIDVFKHFSLI